ncbi:MAG: InlB B-repeat-containing protein, partial [Bacilli bacterium]|nr:InlB B-repeat-containing protein [Bacilli bacterium]
HGNDSTTEGAIRVQDKFVSFTLMKEVGNDNWETIIDSESYDDFEEPLRIYVDKINANTTSSVTHKYRLYVWLNRDMTIYGGDLTSEAGDYSIAEYKKLYTSVKIQVTGDYKAKNYEIPVHTVTFDYNDGVTESTTKRVVYHGHYGTLPTPPEREGYTFMGWNGKNLFNEDNITEQRFTEFNEQKILLDASSVLDNRMDRLELQLYKNGVRVTIYTGFYFTTVNKSTQITKNDTFDAILFKANTNKRDPYFIFSLNNLVDDKKYNLSFNILAYDTSISKVTISNFQLEEGDTVTEYEPCFITSGTKVVQDKNHTLTAIWKENN